MRATLYKVYCLDEPRRRWFEVECDATGEGISWSNVAQAALSGAKERGYVVANPDDAVIRWYDGLARRRKLGLS